MGILDTALQKLSDPASSLAMAEDTIRDMRHRQENAMGRNADRASTMFRDIRAQSEAREGREHEAELQGERLGAEAGLQDERIGAEREFLGQQQEHESTENRLDRLHQMEMAETEWDMRRQLQELQNEHEQLLQTDRQNWTSTENELDRELRWRIAQLQASLERERLSAQHPELAEQGDLLSNYLREVEKLRQTGYDWQWDPNAEQYVYVGEDSPEDIKQRLFQNIDGDNRYSEEERAALKSFIDNNFHLVLGQDVPDEGGGDTGRWLNEFGWSGNADRMQGAMGQTDILNPNSGLSGQPSEFWPNVGEHLREEPEWAGPIRGGWGREERVMEMDIKSTIDRLRGQSLTPAEEGVVDHVEQALTEEVRKHPGVDSTSALQELLQLLSPIDSGQDEARRPGTGPASGGRNFRE